MVLNRLTLGKKAVAVWDDPDVPPAKTAGRFLALKPALVGVVVAMIAGILSGLLLPSGDWDYSHRFPPPGPNPRNGIAAVAGEYYQGARVGQSWHLDLLSDGRYSFIWSGCLGVYHRESGSLSRIGGLLLLSPVQPIEPQMERVFLPLNWGRRSYLIPPQRFEEFCDAIIQGDEPRTRGAGRFYLQGLDDRVAGIPELPEPWATYAHKHLIIGTIVEVMEGGRARIDVGAADGLRAGRLMTVQRGDGRQLRVISVSEGSCEVEDEYPGEKHPLEAGWNVVTAREAEAEPHPY